MVIWSIGKGDVEAAKFKVEKQKIHIWRFGNLSKLYIDHNIFSFWIHSQGWGDLEWVGWGVSKGAAMMLERRRGKDKVRRRREEKFGRKNSEVRVDERRKDQRR